MIGGITVLTDLNPWIVSFHLLVSLAMVGLSVVLLLSARRGRRPARPLVPAGAAGSPAATSASAWLVLYVGTVVTGCGPHAGDANAPRNGLDPRALEPAPHRPGLPAARADRRAVLVLRAAGAPAAVRRAASRCSPSSWRRALIGFVQYFTGLPVAVVAAAHAGRRPGLRRADLAAGQRPRADRLSG